MKICAISDLHGYLDCKIDSDTEVLIIAGDIISLYYQTSMVLSEAWFKEEFMDFINNLPKSIKKVYIIGGNHDFYIERCHNLLKQYFANTIVELLNNEYSEYTSNDGQLLKVFGSPYCKIFGHWAYMISNDKLEKKFDMIPNNIDILITHDAPYGTSDICLQDIYWNTHEHIGNIPLQKAIIEKHPKWNIHGHLHSTNHVPEKLGDTNVVNVSLLDEQYICTYNPFYFNI